MARKMKTLIELLREEFKQRLSRKTNWGRNEVWLEFEISISNATLKRLDQERKHNKSITEEI